MAATKIRNFRLTPDELSTIDRIAKFLQQLDPMNRPVTNTDVVRHAIQTLSDSLFPEKKQGKKKSEKSSKSS